jgi:Fe2+ transport system protein B
MGYLNNWEVKFAGLTSLVCSLAMVYVFLGILGVFSRILTGLLITCFFSLVGYALFLGIKSFKRWYLRLREEEELLEILKLRNPSYRKFRRNYHGKS